MADLAGRADLESEFAARMGRLSDGQRARLVELLGDPPDPANVPEEFWREVEKERREELALLLLLIFLLAARQHGEPEGPRVELAASAYASRRASEVVALWAETTRGKLAARGAEWRQRRIDAGAGGVPSPGTGAGGPTSEVPKSPGGGPTGDFPSSLPGRAEAEEAAEAVFAPSRDGNAAVTETTAAGSAGAEWAVRSSGRASNDDVWWTEADDRVCPVCGPLHRQQRPVWSRFFPEGPPAHPQCRCRVEYASGAGTAPVPAEAA